MSSVWEREQQLLSKYFEEPRNVSDVGLPLLKRVSIWTALAVAQVYMPPTIEICGRIILALPGAPYAECDRERIESTLRNPTVATEEKTKLLDSFNWIETFYLFSQERLPKQVGEGDLDNVDRFLSARLREAWDAWFRFSRPDRKITVRTIDPEETGSSWGVGFTEENRPGFGAGESHVAVCR